ncbi:PRC-barrel domain containing protein [Streptomyces xanthophaeus]|uniref:PRC-barrel domain containing protein n=1 Tax=Streptomyces xanthophaeus TaxID=67385 RepID=UPI00371FF977
MITQEQLSELAGFGATTERGLHIGAVEYVLVDDTTGRPEWARIVDRASGLGGVFIPLRHAELIGERLVVPYPVALIEEAPCAAVECGSVLSVTQEAQLFRHYGLRDPRDEVNAENGAGWGPMDRAEAIREGTEGREDEVTRLRRVPSGA